MSQQWVRQMNHEAGEFVKVAEVNDITAGQGRLVEMHGRRITIFNSHGAFYATESRCVYCDGSLLKAHLMGTEIQCPSDGASFYLPTGESVRQADNKRLATYRVRVDGHEVQIKWEAHRATRMRNAAADLQKV